jgi:hypothetical protein
MAPPPKLDFSLEDLSISIDLNGQLNIRSGTFNVRVERSVDGSGSGRIQISGFISDPGEFAQVANFLVQQGQL